MKYRCHLLTKVLGAESHLKNNPLNPARAVSSSVATAVVVGLIAVAIVATALYTSSTGTTNTALSTTYITTSSTSNHPVNSGGGGPCVENTLAGPSQSSSVEYFVGRPILAGNVPYAMAYDPQNQRLYIANNPNGGMINDSNTVTVVDVLTYNIVDTIRGFPGSPWAMAYDPFTNSVYVTDSGSGMVSVINTSTDKISANITIGGDPTGIVYDSANHVLYVASSLSGEVSALNSTNYIFARVMVGGYPVGLAYNSQNNDIYVANNANNSIQIISGLNTSMGAQIPGEGNYQGGSPSAGLPYTIVYDPNTNQGYFTDNDSNRVSVIDASTNRIIQNVTVGQFPSGITFDPSTNEILVANWGSSSVSVIDGYTNSVVANITGVGSHPFGVGYDSYDDHVFVTDQSSIYVYPIILNATNSGAPPTQTSVSGSNVSSSVRVLELPVSQNGTINAVYCFSQTNGHQIQMQPSLYSVNYTSSSLSVEACGTQNGTQTNSCPGIEISASPSSLSETSYDNETVVFIMNTTSSAKQELYVLQLPDLQCSDIPIFIGNQPPNSVPSNLFPSSCLGSMNYLIPNIYGYGGFTGVNIQVSRP